ncbi:MAG: arginase, partial [Gammaproteobacteria bacterium]|nr:arginase [Gammaproteobacteria bacterium]
AGVIPALEKLGHEIVSHNNVSQISQEAVEVGDSRARFLQAISDTCVELADTVSNAVSNGHFPLVLGGDHSQAIGTVAGLARHYGATEKKDVGIFWVDAHADMNTPKTSPSGNIHGMPLATLLGYGPDKLTTINGEAPVLKPEHVVIFGARDIDRNEAELVKESGVRVFTMSEIDRRGVQDCLDEAMKILSKADAGIHLSYDLDGSDPSVAPGVGTPVPGGLNFRESHLICEILAKSGRLIGMEMVELNPTLDVENKTGKFAVWLIQSAFGRTIL